MAPPTPEYCFLWLDHWSTCMTKAEWSGWAQAIGTILAVAAAMAAPYLQAYVSKRAESARISEGLRPLARTLRHWRDSCESTLEVRRALVVAPEDAELLSKLAVNYDSYNHAAQEINRFNFSSAPSGLVMDVIARYRALCSPLSNFMTYTETTCTPQGLQQFQGLIAQISQLSVEIEREADRIAGKPALAISMSNG